MGFSFLFLEKTCKEYRISETTGHCMLAFLWRYCSSLSWPSLLRAGKWLVSEYGRLTCGGRNPYVHRTSRSMVEGNWNVMAHAQKPDFVFRLNGRVHLNRRGRQFSRLLAAEVCASAVVMLDTPCSEVVWKVLATHCIRQFPLHFPSRASPCAITFQLDSYSTVK